MSFSGISKEIFIYLAGKVKDRTFAAHIAK